jgi:hypothetical protein
LLWQVATAAADEAAEFTVPNPIDVAVAAAVAGVHRNHLQIHPDRSATNLVD